MLDIPLNSLYAILAVFCILIVATVICLILKIMRPEKDFTELQQRIRSWWVIIILLFLFLMISETASIIFFAFLSFLALKEFFSIVPTRLADRRVIFWAYLSIPFQYYWIYINWYSMFLVFIPVYIFLLIPMRMALIGETKGFIKSSGIIQWGVILTVFFISHIVYLLILPTININAGDIGLVLFLLIFTQFNDVCQYIWGKLLGRHKIIPKVSPNKTWEGFIGGVITTTLCAGFAASFLTPLNMWYGFIAGFIISAAGFIGDVVISSVKRDLHIKDSGTMIPGHGGILDRLDSLIYTAPLFFHFIYFFCY
jgi:phosphatidate cytidylyltransferase